jgi:hypothetical protein
VDKSIPELEDINPAPHGETVAENSFANVTVLDVQNAIHRRMLNYAGTGGKGIEGVWNAIDPAYKFPDDAPLSGVKDKDGEGRIKKKTFRREVSRLKNEPKNQNMNFGMRGNILLTLNVLEILGLFNRSDLLAIRPQKRNMKALIVDSSTRIKSLEKKLDALSLSMEMSLKRTPRFTAFKVAHDWENILKRVYAIIHEQDDPAFSFHENEDGIKLMLRQIAQSTHPDSRFLFSIYNLLNDYEEYFYQDFVLYGFFKFLRALQAGKLAAGYQNKISPLYILYFFLQMNKRFLMMLNKADEQYNLESFRNKKLLQIHASESYENDRLMELMGGDKPGAFLYKINNAMYKTVKRIIMLLQNNNQRISDNLRANNTLFAKNSISAFHNIYMHNTSLDTDKLNAFMEKNKETILNDLYSKIAIGIMNYFIIAEKNVDELIDVRNQLANYEDRLIRDFGDY